MDQCWYFKRNSDSKACLRLEMTHHHTPTSSRIAVESDWKCKFLPITLLAYDLFFSVANPKSPIFTLPVVPVIKMLSHLRSLWITGGLREWRKESPFRIWRHHDFSTWKISYGLTIEHLHFSSSSTDSKPKNKIYMLYLR